MILTLINYLIIDQETEKMRKSNNFTRFFNTNYYYFICLFTSSVNQPVCVRHASTNLYYLWCYLLITFTLIMLDNNSNTPLRNVNKIIIKALKVWEKYDIKNMNLGETFPGNVEVFTEEIFKSASIYQLYKVRNYFQKYGI